MMKGQQNKLSMTEKASREAGLLFCGNQSCNQFSNVDPGINYFERASSGRPSALQNKLGHSASWFVILLSLYC